VASPRAASRDDEGNVDLMARKTRRRSADAQAAGVPYLRPWP
jgi:hypothetical protein